MHKMASTIMVMCSDLGTLKKFLGHVWIGIKGSMGTYYLNHMIHMGTKKGRKGF